MSEIDLWLVLKKPEVVNIMFIIFLIILVLNLYYWVQLTDAYKNNYLPMVKQTCGNLFGWNYTFNVTGGVDGGKMDSYVKPLP